MQLPRVIPSRAEKFSPLHKARPRRAAFAGTLIVSVLAVCVLATGTLSAHAATTTDSSAAGFAAAATPYQNKVLDAAMARVPGGTRVSSSEVEWGGGRVILGVSAPATVVDTPVGIALWNPGFPSTVLDCTVNYYCAYGAPNEAGDCWMYIEDLGAGGELNWAAYSGEYCGSVGTWSWQNMTPYRVWKEQDFSGETLVGSPFYYDGGTPSGNTWCISPSVSNNDVTDSISRELGWIYMSDNTSLCPSGS